MDKKPASTPAPVERRSFLTRFNAGAASLAAVVLGSTALAQDRPEQSSASGWQPERHAQDDWMDQLPGKHRLIFDTTHPDGLNDGLLYASNFIAVNGSAYSLEASDLAVIVVARHASTAYAYNDAMWEKYGSAMAARAGIDDPSQAPKNNRFNRSLSRLASDGVQFGVCSVATRGNAGLIARNVDGDADAIFEELSANLVDGARLVPAGIVAVSRAQERGYTLVTV